MNKLALAALLLVLASGFFLFSQKSDGIPEKVEEVPSNLSEAFEVKASFDIYTNGTKRIFTDPKYHNLSPDIFIESSNPNTVNVRKRGATWNDFFKTLPMDLTKECLITGTKQTFCTGENGTLRFYINELEDKEALEREINEGDTLVVRYGK